MECIEEVLENGSSDLPLPFFLSLPCPSLSLPSLLARAHLSICFFWWEHSDEDMVAMYLSDHRTRPLGTAQREEKDHGEIEILLESVQRQVEEIVNEVETTVVSFFVPFFWDSEGWGCESERGRGRES